MAFVALRFENCNQLKIQILLIWLVFCFVLVFFFGCAGFSLWCMGFLLPWILLLQSTGSRARRLQQQRNLGSVVVADGPSCFNQHVELSQTRDRTSVPCIGRQILNHCTTREVQILLILTEFVLQHSSECLHRLVWLCIKLQKINSQQYN